MKLAAIAAVSAACAVVLAGPAAASQNQTPPPATFKSPDRPPATAPPTKAATPTDPIVARFSPLYDGCMHKAASTLDMIDCASRENDRWDARLNRAYQSRLSSFNDRQRSALKRAQKAWVSFRDADCSAYEDEDWGSISKIDASQCVLRRTIERALELESFSADHGPG